MNNHQLSKIIAILLASSSLLACNSGNSSSNTSSATTANPLQQYINLLTYSDLHSDIVNKLSTQTSNGNQQSFAVIGETSLSSIDIRYYSDSSCNVPTNIVTLQGPAVLPQGNYTSSNRSNSALCGHYSGGCEGLLTSAINGNIKSMKFVYNYIAGGSSAAPCMYNSSQGYEVIANYDSNPAVACNDTGAPQCGFSQHYASFNLPIGIAILDYNLVGGGAISGCNGGAVFGLTQIESNLVATKNVSSCGYYKTSISDNTTPWGSYGSGSGTPIRLAYDSGQKQIIVSRSNGNVLYGAGSGTSIGSPKFSSASNNVLGLAYNSSSSLVYAFQNGRTPTNGGYNSVSNSGAWTNISFESETRSLYVESGNVKNSRCYGSAVFDGDLYEGGCGDSDAQQMIIYKNGVKLSDNQAPSSIRSLLISDDGVNLFIGESSGLVHRVSGW